MGLEENKQLCRDYFAAFLARDEEWIRAHIAPGFERHCCATSGSSSFNPAL